MIYAGTNGYLDALPLNKVRAFEDGLLSLLRGKNVEILNGIRDSRDLSDDTRRQAEERGRKLRQDVCLMICGCGPALAGPDKRVACGRVVEGRIAGVN